MVKLKYNSQSVRNFLKEIIQECYVLDMMEDPEVDMSLGLEERTKGANSWLECGKQGLEIQRQYSLFELDNVNSKNLCINLYSDAQKKVNRVFRGIVSRAEKRYGGVIQGKDN